MNLKVDRWSPFVGATVLALAAAAPALAQVSVTSRLSTLHSGHIDEDPRHPSNTEETQTYGELGFWHNSWASDSELGAAISGDWYRPLGYETWFSDCSMRVRFSVSGSDTTAQIRFDGGDYPGSEIRHNNVSLYLVNMDTNELVFDIYRDGTRRLQHDGLELTGYWDDQTRFAGLIAGNYEFFTQTSGTDVGSEGSGTGVHGYGRLNSSLTFVPSPGSAMLLAVSMPMLTRRRRR